MESACFSCLRLLLGLALLLAAPATGRAQGAAPCEGSIPIIGDLDQVLGRMGTPDIDTLMMPVEPVAPLPPPAPNPFDITQKVDVPCKPARGKDLPVISNMEDWKKAKALDQYAITLATGEGINIHTIGKLENFSNNKVMNDVIWGVPQYYGRGLAKGVAQGSRIVEDWLVVMEYAKSLATADPKAGSVIEQATTDKVIGDLTDAAVDALEGQLTEDASHDAVRAAKATSVFAQLSEDYASPEDPVRRAFRIGFDVMIVPIKLVMGGLKSDAIQGEQKRKREYLSAEQYVRSLDPCDFTDSWGKSRFDLPESIQVENLPKHLQDEAWLVHHLWALVYVTYRRENPRSHIGFRLPRHGAFWGNEHPSNQPLYFDRNTATWKKREKGTHFPKHNRLYKDPLPHH